jgi:uncharacterized protein (TIGR02757 family)
MPVPTPALTTRLSTCGKQLAAIKGKLDAELARVSAPLFIAADPVQFPRRYSRKEDREIAAFLTATIAWGRRDMILRSAERMFSLMGESPYDFVMAGDYRKLKEACIHRTFFDDDLRYFCKGLRACYQKYGDLEELFAVNTEVWEGISLFRKEIARGNGGIFSKHIANPDTGSACKRINLALRWLVRKDRIDMGIWKRLKRSALFIPLDVHVGRSARALGLLERKSADRKAVVELTEKLRLFCPADPVRYDIALFSI